ncbi:abrupt [Blattella germanica]|nr:hypothetical protein C0J52_26295 [Blattella germanica]
MGEVSDPEQQYSLRWNDFHASILSSFRHLRDEEDFVDVTLACDGCSFTAHKVVLSACSPYFRRLLKANPCQHPIVILRDVKEKDMESLLRFMYNGEVHIGQEQLTDFLKTAQMLQVRGLAEVPTKENQKLAPTSNSLPWSQSGELRDHFPDDALSPPPKRSRNSEHRFSPSPASSATNNNNNNNTNNNNGDPMMRETLLGQALEGGPTIHTSGSTHQNKGNSDSSLQAQSTGEDSNSSDTAMSERGGPMADLLRPKSEPNDYGSMDDNNHHHGNGNLGLDATRTPPFPAALLGLQKKKGSERNESFILTELTADEVDRSWWQRQCAVVKDDDQQQQQSRPTCPHCYREYSNVWNLKQHIVNVHVQTSAEQWETCNQCGKKFKTRQYLTMHQYRVHGIKHREQNQLFIFPQPNSDPSVTVPRM